MHILLVEDDLSLGQSLSKSLQLERMTIEWVRTSRDAKRFIETNHYDCVLLDLSLPDGQGMSLLQAWRSVGLATPILIISAQSALETRLSGLDSGADDFILKPFPTVELISRIHAVVRRSVRQSHDVWTFGELQIKPKQNFVSIYGQALALTNREFTILVTLAQHAGETISKNKIAERLVPLGDPLDFGALEVHISNLRKKLGGDYIKTVRGVGYQLKVAA